LPFLQWNPIDELSPDQEYLVELRFVENGQPTYLTEPLGKRTSWQVPSEFFRRLDPDTREIKWQILVINDDGDKFSVSETRTFTWDLYEPPLLQNPVAGGSFSGVEGISVLTWEPIDLGSDDYYVVRLQYSENERIIPYNILHWTRNTSLEIPFEILQRVGEDGQEIRWEVEVAYIQGDRIEKVLSKPGETRSFTWKRKPLADGEGLEVAVRNDSNQIFAMVKPEGEERIYKSNNGGIDWSSVLTQASVKTLHIAPSNTNVMYAGAYGQISRSLNQGNSWDSFLIQVGTPPQRFTAQVHAITTAPDKANIVFAATDHGILRSNDGGENWSGLIEATDGVIDRPFYTIVTTSVSEQDNRVYTAGEGNQIYWRSTDDPSPASPWNTLICNFCTPPIYSLAIDSQNGALLLAGSKDGKVALSPNLGGDWYDVPIPSPISNLKISKLAIDPNDSQIIYAGTSHDNVSYGQGMYRGEIYQDVFGGDYKVNWQPLNTWVHNRNSGIHVQDMTIIGQNIFIASSEGVFHSTDDGGTWDKQ